MMSPLGLSARRRDHIATLVSTGAWLTHLIMPSRWTGDGGARSGTLLSVHISPSRDRSRARDSRYPVAWRLVGTPTPMARIPSDLHRRCTYHRRCILQYPFGGEGP